MPGRHGAGRLGRGRPWSAPGAGRPGPGRQGRGPWSGPSPGPGAAGHRLGCPGPGHHPGSGPGHRHGHAPGRPTGGPAGRPYPHGAPRGPGTLALVRPSTCQDADQAHLQVLAFLHPRQASPPSVAAGFPSVTPSPSVEAPADPEAPGNPRGREDRGGRTLALSALTSCQSPWGQNRPPATPCDCVGVPVAAPSSPVGPLSHPREDRTPRRRNC